MNICLILTCQLFLGMFYTRNYFFLGVEKELLLFDFRQDLASELLLLVKEKALKKINTESVFSKVICISCTLGS